MRLYCNLREVSKLLFAILKTKELPANYNLTKKDSKIIRITHPPANSTQADSGAILPNRM